MMGVTRQQARVLEFVRRYAKGYGYSPTLEEIGEFIGLASRSSVHRLLTLLKDRGLVTWEAGKARSIRLLSAEDRLAEFTDAELIAECKRRGL